MTIIIDGHVDIYDLPDEYFGGTACDICHCDVMGAYFYIAVGIGVVCKVRFYAWGKLFCGGIHNRYVRLDGVGDAGIDICCVPYD